MSIRYAVWGGILRLSLNESEVDPFTSDKIEYMSTKPLHRRTGVFYCLVAEAETRPVSCLLKTWHDCIMMDIPYDLP